jgi:hypothetical protein
MVKGEAKMITEVIKAVKAGEELKDPAKWKNRVETINLVGIVLAAVVMIIRWRYPTVVIPDGVTEYIAEIIGTILAIINLYFNRATTKKDFKGQ